MKNRGGSPKPKNAAGPQVRAAREAKGLFQDELARRMRARGHPMGRLQVLKLEAGSRYVTDTELLSLAVILGRSPHELLGYEATKT